jgi:16S rRNA (adenine1518-N6/adenine1519-N6)-dimethyltransferase
MDLTNISTIKQILAFHNIRPNRRLGQNFLIDRSVLAKVVAAGEISADDNILEIGPGIGVLTNEMIQKAKMVYAVEKDSALSQIAKNTFPEAKNLEVIEGDFLDIDMSGNVIEQNPLADLSTKKFKVISNLPYQITSPVVRKLLGSSWDIELIVLMIQKEVAERITAEPGSSARGYLTVLVEFYAESEIVAKVATGSFWPAPEVESAIIRLTPKDKRTGIDDKKFFMLVRAGFSSKRKQFLNSLSGGLQIDKDKVLELLKTAQIEPSTRAEDLTLEQWLELYKSFK